MTFAHPGYLWLLLVIPPALAAFFWWARRERRRLMTVFIQDRLLSGLTAGVSPARQQLRGGLLIAAAVCLILTLARPQWGFDWDEVTQRGLDIVVAIDTSKSMLAEDIAPNRLDRAKLAALELMQQARSDRLGLVAFAGTAFLQCPLTIDDAAFRQSVESLDVHTLPEGGTALAEAITTALAAFKEGDNFKALVIFTDGEDHDSGALEAAEKAREAGLIIFTIGIGSADGQLLRIRMPDGRTDYVRDEDGNVVSSRLNESLLQQVAGPAPHGFYLPLRGANTIDVLYERGLAPLPKSDATEKWVQRPRERYHWPLAAAVLLLLVEVFVPERKNPARSGRSRAPKSSALAAALLLICAAPLPAHGSAASALRQYNAGNFNTALSEYEEALKKKGDDPRLHFNAGAAAYRNQQFTNAAHHFSQATLSPDLNLQARAYYNLGNTHFQLGAQSPDPASKARHWEESLKHFDSSLKLSPQDADSRFNHNFVQRQLEELRKQQQEQQQQSGSDRQQQNPQNQDQQNDSSDPNQQNQDQQQQSGQQPQDSAQQEQRQASPADQENHNEGPDSQPSQQQPRPQEGAESSADSHEQGEAAPGTPGQMTPEQARRLLDAQKGDERLLPPPQERRDPSRPRSRKDW